MAIVMNDQRVTELFGVQPRAGRPERPQTNGDVEKTIEFGTHRRQKRKFVRGGTTRNVPSLRQSATREAEKIDTTQQGGAL